MQTIIHQADGSTQTYNGGTMVSSTPAPSKTTSTVSAPTTSSYTPSHSSSPSYSQPSTDPSSAINYLGQLYNQAMANGNTSLAQQYHQQANALRSSNGMATYYDSNTDPQTGTTGTTTTGTTGSTTGSLASQMLNAAQNPYSGTTHWNINGTTFDTPVGSSSTSYSGRSVTTMANLAQQLGIQYTKDPNTGAIKVNGQTVNPVGVDSNGNAIVQVRQVLNAMGVPDEQIKYDQKTGNVNVSLPQQQQTQQTPYQPIQVPDVMKQIGPMPQMPQLQGYYAPDLSTYYQHLMPMQSAFTPDWTTYYNQAHQQFDPTTNADMQSLITKMNQDITASDEKMNARGIFNSGLAQANEDLVRGDSSNAIAKVLANSQSNIAKVAQQLYTDAYDQWYKGNSLAVQNNQMWLNQAMNQEKQAYTEWLGQQNLTMDQYKNALTAWDNAANAALKQAQMSVTAQQDNNANAMKMYQFNNLSADQSANLAQKQYEFNNLSAQQKAQDAISQQKNQLDLFKMLGYVQMPDGSVKPTEQTTMDQQKLAIQLAQTLGYYTTPDGKIIPTQQANYQNAQIQLDNNKLTAQIHQWAADNQLKSAQIGLDQQKLQEKSQYDQAMIDKASQAAQNESDKIQLEALKSQMISVTDQIKAYQDAGKMPPDNLTTQYDNIMKSVDKIAGTNSSSDMSGFPSNGTPSGSFSNFLMGQ